MRSECELHHLALLESSLRFLSHCDAVVGLTQCAAVNVPISKLEQSANLMMQAIANAFDMLTSMWGTACLWMERVSIDLGLLFLDAFFGHETRRASNQTARWATSTIKQREPVGNDISVVEAGIGHIFEIQRMCESSSTMAPRWGQMSRWGGARPEALPPSA